MYFLSARAGRWCFQSSGPTRRTLWIPSQLASAWLGRSGQYRGAYQEMKSCQPPEFFLFDFAYCCRGLAGPRRRKREGQQAGRSKSGRGRWPPPLLWLDCHHMRRSYAACSLASAASSTKGMHQALMLIPARGMHAQSGRPWGWPPDPSLLSFYQHVYPFAT